MRELYQKLALAKSRENLQLRKKVRRIAEQNKRALEQKISGFKIDTFREIQERFFNAESNEENSSKRKPSFRKIKSLFQLKRINSRVYQE